MPTALELAEKLASANSVDWRGPFLDHRLAEFCLSLPGDQKLSHGLNRRVARTALVGTLPDLHGVPFRNPRNGPLSPT